MKISDIQTGLIHQSSEITPMGGVSVGAFIRNSPGLVERPMRLLGSYAVVYILAGGGFYSDPMRERVTVGAGDLLVVFPDHPHTYFAPPGGGWTEIYLMFAGASFDLLRAKGVIGPEQPILRLEPLAYWLEKLQSVVAPVSALEQVGRLGLFLAEAVAQQRRAGMDAPEQDFLQRAQGLLDAAALTNRSVQQVARELGMPYETFRKRFTRLTGAAPARYLASRTVARAADLLHRRELSLRQIAEACGFCDEFHFSHRFKQATGVSPKGFRRRLGLDR